ncbi:hypothetical protein [Gandjariella thermophila]|uniref:Uncharacterized protein n=1 Tax=Gandjariella thermophila TaxID=1931992 RepID=A0A4D4J0L0_9PSEU|nr:hypothetical protein [Gandjariella thermophila]GDY30155.1 hypothetical protein GTS_17880 [Gandjariella thermophila]
MTGPHHDISSGAYPGQVSGPQPVPSAPWPAGTGPHAVPSGPHAVPAAPQQSTAGPPGGWSYGLPPGARPELVNTPIGQAGALANSAWQQRADRRVPFPALVAVELRKLFGTVSDRIMLALAPLYLAGVTLFGLLTVASAPATAAQQVLGAVVGAEFGGMLVHATVIKVIGGEWHYRSVQLTLLLQPSRLRYAAAQAGALGVVWLTLTAAEFGVFYPVAVSHIGQSGFQLYLNQRIGWVLAVIAVGNLLSLLVCLAVALLLPNPTAGITVYYVVTVLLAFRFEPWPVVWFLDPFGLLNLLAGTRSDALPVLTGTLLLAGVLTLGVLSLRGRDAR